MAYSGPKAFGVRPFEGFSYSFFGNTLNIVRERDIRVSLEEGRGYVPFY